MLHPTQGKGERLSNDDNGDVIMTLGATKTISVSSIVFQSSLQCTEALLGGCSVGLSLSFRSV